MSDQSGGFAAPCEWVHVDGRIVPAAEAAVSVHAHALSYGTGTFEGIRAWWNAEHGQLYLLEARAHYERLIRSAKILGLNLSVPVDELLSATAELLRHNEVRSDAYVRPLFVQAGAALPVRMHDVHTRLSIAVTPMPGDYISPDGVRCMVSSWRRAPDVSTPNRAKVTGSYTGPALAKTEAAGSGFDEAIMLTADGHVAEATTSNIFLRTGDEWVTPPGTDDILEGITRAQVMRHQDWTTPVYAERTKIMSDTYHELPAMPVKQIWENVSARIVHSELISMVVVELAPNAVVPEHHHVNEQLGFVIKGSITFTVDGETRERGPGEAWRILADVPHQAVAGPEGAVVVEVYSPVRADWAALPDSAARTPVWPASE